MTRKKRVRKIRRGFRLGCGTCVLALTACLALVFLGIPPALLGPVLDGLAPEGVNLEADQLYYRAGKGWVLENPEVYSPGNRVSPWLTLERLTVRADWIRGLRTGEWRGELGVHGGRIDTDLGYWADDLVTRQDLEVRGIHGTIAFTPDTIRLDEANATVGGVRVRASGSLPTSFRGEGAPPARGERDVAAFIRRAARNLAPAVRFLNEFSFSGAPELRLEVRKAPESTIPIAASLRLEHEGGGAHRGFEFEAIRAAAEYRAGVLDIEWLEVREREDRRLQVTGRVDFNEETLYLELENTLRRYGVETLSPFSLGKLLAKLQIRVQDRCDFRLTVGPSPFGRIGSRLKGRFQVADAFYRDAFFPELDLEVAYRDRVLTLNRFEGRIGQGDRGGPVKGSFLYGLDSKRMALELEGAFKPAAAVSLAGGTVESYIRDWEFRGAPPMFSLRADRAGRSDPMDVRLDLSAEELLCRGTLFRSLKGRLEMNDDRVAATGIRATRGSEVLEGSFYAPRSLESFELVLDSTFHLPDLAPFAGPRMVEILRPFRFKGASRVRVEGHVDLSGRHLHDLGGEVEFTDMVYRWMQFDRVTASFGLVGESLSVSEVRGELVEGTLAGSFGAKELFSEEGRFALDLKVEDLDLFKVITAATDKENTPYTGDLKLDLKVEGPLRDGEERPRTAGLEGEGSVAIREGELFRIPLLLGLSRILSKVVKGFGYAAQSDFTADFTIGDGKIESDNLFLKGRLLSIAGEGSYRFDGKIGANVKVQLLSDGLVSDALKVLLWPIRKLIEIQLTGTVDNPNWQPRNLPKELFGK